MMHRLIASAALVALLTLGSYTDAEAWERKGSRTGPRGTASFGALGNCSGSSCTRDSTATGVNGRTFSRSGQGSCAGGSCSGGRVTTGPGGRTYARQGSASCADGSCTRDGAFTGPNGETVSRQSSITR